MQYARLICEKPGVYDGLGEPEREAIYGEYMTIAGDARTLSGAQLHPADTATTVRMNGGGELLTTDGPFADTKEVFGGFFLIEATTSTARSRSPGGSRPSAWAAASRSAPSWSSRADRPGLPRRVGARRRRPGRLPPRLRPGGGAPRGGVPRRGGALAARRPPRQPGRLAADDRPPPGDRPAPPRAHARRQDAPARGAGDRRRRDGRFRHPRRAPRARLRLLPSGAGARGARRTDAPRPRRAVDRGDRAGVPRRAGGDEAPAVAREAQDPRRRDSVRHPARAPARRAPRRRARRRLPHLQRGLLGRRRPRRPRRRGDPARPRARRPHARRAGGAWPARAHALPRRAPRRARRRRRDRAARRPGPLALGRGPDRGRPGGARSRARAARPG